MEENQQEASWLEWREYCQNEESDVKCNYKVSGKCQEVHVKISSREDKRKYVNSLAKDADNAAMKVI